MQKLHTNHLMVLMGFVENYQTLTLLLEENTHI